MRIFYLSLISGFLSYLSVSLPRLLSRLYPLSDDVLLLFPGLLFCLFILWPLAKDSSHRGFRWAGLIVASVTAWYIAVSIGIQALPMSERTPVISVGLSGSVGVLILSVTSRYLVPINIKLASTLSALLVGFIGGCIIGMAVAQPRGSLAGESLYLVGFVFWQMSVAVALFHRSASLKTMKI